MRLTVSIAAPRSSRWLMIWNRQLAPNLTIAQVAEFIDAQPLGFDVGGQRTLEAAKVLMMAPVNGTACPHWHAALPMPVIRWLITQPP